MTAMIRYRLHFLILLVAAPVVWLARDVDTSVRIAGFNLSFYFVLIGVLHATSVAVSLRNRKSARLIDVLSFVTLAAVWSAATPILALWSSALWNLHSEPVVRGGLDFILILVTGSTIGAAGYWLLVRTFWLKSLGRMDCLRTVALCVAATLVSLVLGMLDQSGKDYYGTLLFTIAWWFAFSLSLYWSEMSEQAKKSTPVIANAS